MNSPFFSGEIEALCLGNPIYDLVIGNVEELKSFCSDDCESFPLAENKADSVPVVTYTHRCDDQVTGGAVETLAQ